MSLTNELFNKILDKKTNENGNELCNVGFNAEAFGYSIFFYGLPEDNYKLIIECCGKETKKGWLDIEPTPLQELKLQALIYDEVARIQQDIDEQHQAEEQSLQAHRDELKYGVAGALYSKSY